MRLSAPIVAFRTRGREMREALSDLLFVMTQGGRTTCEKYDRAASRYDRLMERWLARGGADTVDALKKSLDPLLVPGVRVLDAGAGTGALARWIAARQPAAHLTMLDQSRGMLARAGDIWGRHMIGDIATLPFEEDEFDVVVSAWALEAIPDTRRAILELLRVVREGGTLCYCFCSLPSSRAEFLKAARLRITVKLGFGGSFLRPDATAWHDGEGTIRRQFHDGLSTLVCHQKERAVRQETAV